MITIIDYGAGNLRSVVNAITKLGYQPKITALAADIVNASVVILPGVGAAGDVMENLKKLRLIDPIRNYIDSGKPFLGICIGMQVLFTHTEEGDYDCLNIIPGQVLKLPAGQKIPQIGWNQVKYKAPNRIFDGVPDNTNFYFVHSYYCQPNDKSLIIGETDYGIPFCSAVAVGNLTAIQFHPEKSGDWGLKIYDNFLKQAQK